MSCLSKSKWRELVTINETIPMEGVANLNGAAVTRRAVGRAGELESKTIGAGRVDSDPQGGKI